MGIYEETEIRFLVAGHTKNVCDSAFEHMKRHFQRTDVLIPSQMNILVNSSSSTSAYIPAPSVELVDWKVFYKNFSGYPMSYVYRSTIFFNLIALIQVF